MIVNPGIRRLLASAMQRLFNAAPFYWQAVQSIVLNRGTGTPTITRATTATVENNDGNLVTALSGELREQGARRIYNLCPTPSTSISVGANKTITVTPGVYVFSMGAEATGTCLITFTGTATGSSGTLTASASERTSAVLTITVGGTIIATCTVQAAADVQFEDVTAQTTQTAGDYVSVGALDYRSDQDPLYLSLPGTAGHYASSPDKDISTGDLAVAVDAFATYWTPAAIQMLFSKDTSGGNREWGLYQASSGVKPLILYWFQTDGSEKTATSTAAPVFPDLTRGQVAVTLDADDGAGNHVVKFWQSSDYWATKTQVGSTITVAGVTEIRNTAATLYVGDYGFSAPFSGGIYSARVWEGIPVALGGAGGETLKVDFNPHRDATTPTGTFPSSTTGEVWTINGASSVVRNINYHGAGVDGVKLFATDISGNPISPDGALVEAAATNLCLQSNSFTTSPWGENSGVLGCTQDAIGPDGATSAWTFTDDSVVSNEGRYQALTLTAATYTYSIFVKKTTGAQPSYPLFAAFEAGGGTGTAAVTIDTSNGVATAWTSYPARTIATGMVSRCASFNNVYWRVEMSFTGTAAEWGVYVLAAGTTNPVLAAGPSVSTVTGSTVFYGAMVNLGSYAETYIPTTTAAVTRNADVISIPTSGNITAATGTAAFTWTPSHDPYGTIALWGTYVDASNYTVILHDGTKYIFRKRIAATNYDAELTVAFVSGTASKIAVTWGAAGTQIAVDGVLGTPHANTTAAQIGTSIQVGADGNSAQQAGAAFKEERLWTRSLSDSELKAITA